MRNVNGGVYMNEIACIVVTFNRKLLLQENIKALVNQERMSKDRNVIDIIIIDNASTDGTKESIQKYIDENLISYVNTGSNLGGAGGFSYGIRLAYEKGYKYAWIMDDDTIPKLDAGKALYSKAKVLDREFSFLCSVVKWTNGELCKMNRQLIDRNWLEKLKLDVNNIIPVEYCSFVSCFINLELVGKVGLPFKEFFIYGDDVEYTRRLNLVKQGYLVTDSLVTHKMATNSAMNLVGESADRIDRYWYRYRNRMYIARKKGITMVIREFMICGRDIMKIIFKSKGGKGKRIYIILRGAISGLKFNPLIERI